MTNEPSGGIPQLLPSADTADRKGVGGTHTHRPDCRCRPCKARRREEEALIRTGGEGRSDVASNAGGRLPLIADEDILVTTPIYKGKDKTRTRLAAWVAMRGVEPTITVSEAAKRLSVNYRTLQKDIITATREGWLRFEDPLDRIDFQLIPKTLDNLNKLLDDEDKHTTIEVAKNTVFRSYQEAKGIGEQQTTVLALKIEHPKDDDRMIITGEILGQPRALTENDETQS